MGTAAKSVTTRTRGVGEKRRPAGNEAAPRDAGSAFEVLKLQRFAGNQAVLAALGVQRQVVLQRKVVTIGTEKVRVANDQEEEEAKAIIARIKVTYDIELSSQTTIEAIKNEYPKVKKKVTDKLKARRWRLRELRALEKALSYYAPILGAARATSGRKGAAQEVTSIGKLEQAIDEDTKKGAFDTETLGEYFVTKKNMGLFKSSEGHKGDFPTERKQLVGTFVHETAHGLLRYAVADFVKETGYWKDEDTKLPKKKRKESPPSEYGETNAEEDLCETAMFYFVDPKKLKKFPKRKAFMEKVGKAWLPPPQVTPTVQPPTTGPAQQPASGGPPAPQQGELPLAVQEVIEAVEESVKALVSASSGAPGLGSK